MELPLYEILQYPHLDMAAAQQACEFCLHVCSRPSNGFLVTRSYCICQTTVNKLVNQSEHKEIMQLVLEWEDVQTVVMAESVKLV